jgi:hypothetical protein
MSLCYKDLVNEKGDIMSKAEVEEKYHITCKLLD